jgi:DNA-binding FadR family transcriptional regulator
MAASRNTSAQYRAPDVLPQTTAARPVRVPKTAELVAAQLRRQIVRGELAEGAALPPESTLMEQFGVSRPTLREAFRVLESEALISVRRGAHGGARVHVPNGDVAARYAALVLEHRSTELADLYTARSVIEPACAELLAQRRDPEDVALLRTALAEDGQDKLGAATAIRTHLQFHALMVRAAGNETLIVLTEMLRHIIDLANEAHVVADAGSPQTERAFRRGHRAHARLIDLIEAGDGQGAHDLWRRHLEEAESYLLDGHPSKTVLDLLG